jgi:hypothetical protein
MRQLQSPDILRVPKEIHAAAIAPTNWKIVRRKVG